MQALPRGEVTMLFTDIDGSTRLLHDLGDAYTDVLAEHHRLMREAYRRHSGVEVDTQGDAFFIVFDRPTDAAAAATEAQRALAEGMVRVRMGIHTGRPHLTDEGYVGMDVHLAARIAAAGHGGQILVSRSTAEALDGQGVALRDLGEHRLKDIPEPEWLFQIQAPGLAPDFPPLRTITNTNLPSPARRLVGRGTELDEICDWVRSGRARLVTLTGPGGTGKTRLALQAGFELLDHFPNGVFFVPLATLRDARLVIPTIAQMLGVRESPGETVLETLAGHLRMRRMLLVLDNVEHLLEAASQVAELVAAAPGLGVIATSREPLRLAAEHEYPLAPLDHGAAVELFCECARAIDPRFERDAATEEICRRLEGLPLAIELAAARVRLLPPKAMLARLEPRLSSLTGGGRDVPERQRTLRATIDWSHDLLSAEEQRLFRQLSVFAGGCSLESAEAVCAADTSVLESLVQKSLVFRRPDREGMPRFWMLATIREYADERLSEAGEQSCTRRRHALHILQLAEAAEPHLLGRGQVEWLGRLEQEFGNIRAAVSSSLAGGDADVALRIASALIDFWDARGSYREAREWLRQGLSAATEAPDDVRAKALLTAGVAAFYGGDAEDARTLSTASLALARLTGDARLTSRALSQLAGVAMLAGSFAETVELAEESAVVAADAHDDAMHAFALNILAIGTYELGDTETAEALFARASALLRAQGDLRDLAILQGNLGGVALIAGDYTRARELFRSAIALSEELGDRGRMPSHHQGMGVAALLDGSLDEAAAHLSIALVDGRQVGDTPTVISALALAAGLMAARGDDRLAGILRGAVDRANEDFGLMLSGADILVDQHLLQPVSATAAWAALVAEGASLPLEEAVEVALDQLHLPRGTTSTHSGE